MSSTRRDITPAEASARPSNLAVAGLLFLVAMVAYLPALSGEFLWDDAGHVTSIHLQSWAGLFRIWFEPGVTQQYYPLLHSAFWLEHQLWGDATLGYHLVNVLWHALSACLFIVFLRRVAVPGALLAGLLFALHPVCVESVAWISEQKNTLSAVFYLLAALAWLRFEDDRRPMRYAGASAWFLAALLTKTVTATLPAALLVVAWWRRGRVSWRRDALPLFPWLVVGIGAGLFTAWFERIGIGAQGADFDLSPVERGLLAGRVFWFYLGKLVWPAELIFFYPRWDVDAGAMWQYLFPAAGLALLGGLVWWTRQTREREPLAAFLLFGGTLVPVLGFVNVYPFVFSYVADHFQYLASLSLFAFVAAGLARLARRAPFGLPWRGAQALAAALLVLLGVLTWRQSTHYVDSLTLYRATLAANPESWVAHQNLAAELAERGNPFAALPHARRAVELRPEDAQTLNNLADVLTRANRSDEALSVLERSAGLQPRHAPTENKRGIALMTLGRVDEAVTHFERAIDLQPTLADAHYNLGLAEAARGSFAAADAHFAETVRLRPEHADAAFNRGLALASSNRLADARPHFEHALKLAPASASLRQKYGQVLFATGQVEDAVAKFKEALRLDPQLPGLHRDLASALQRLGRTEEARHHAAEASRQP